MIYKLIFISLFLFQSNLLPIDRFDDTSTLIKGKVVSITDGDTFKLLTQDSTLYRIRLANIDCPERKQPFSKRAKQFTSDAIFGKMVTVEKLSADRNSRIIGIVHYNDTLVLNEELLKAGFAWHYRKYSKDEYLQILEDKARVNKVGLWVDPHAIEPWKWRIKRRKN
jgi:micrococcal nuclease